MRFFRMAAAVAFAFVCGSSSISHFAQMAEARPPEQLLLSNARLAASDQKATDALKIWLAHVAFLAQGGNNRNDGDMRSVLWWNVAHGGLCPDLLPPDSQGAGLWPLALHNFDVANVSARRSRGRDVTPPFEAFSRGRQARKVHPDDILSASEIASFAFAQGRCGARRQALELTDTIAAGDLYAREKDRVRMARAMQIHLVRALDTIRTDKVTGLSVVKARIFDLTVYITDALERSKSREDRGRKDVPADEGAFERQEGEEGDAPKDARTRAADAFYKEIASWDNDDWLALSSQRRLFLYAGAARRFEAAAAVSKDAGAAHEAFLLSLLDAATARKDGKEAMAWIAHLDAADSLPRRKALWSGDRGLALLSLDTASSFKERAPLHLHRGIDGIEAGTTREALRELALAISASDESAGAEALRVLTRRWLTFVLGTYDVDDEMLAVLRDALPAEDAGVVREDLAWRAALRSDKAGFARLTGARLSSATRRRLEMVTPLASGNGDLFIKSLATAFADDPQGAAKSLDVFLTRVEREDPDVRARLTTLLAEIRKLTLGTRAALEKSEAGAKRLEILGRLLARLDALTRPDEIRSLSASAAVFAGSVRVPPDGVVPWPFVRPEVQPPVVFSPLVLSPVDRQAVAGGADASTPVAGWSISE